MNDDLLLDALAKSLGAGLLVLAAMILVHKLFF